MDNSRRLCSSLVPEEPQPTVSQMTSYLYPILDCSRNLPWLYAKTALHQQHSTFHVTPGINPINQSINPLHKILTIELSRPTPQGLQLQRHVGLPHRGGALTLSNYTAIHNNKSRLTSRQLRSHLRDWCYQRWSGSCRSLARPELHVAELLFLTSTSLSCRIRQAEDLSRM